MPKNYMIIINNYFINSGFFINSFDSNLTIYPQYFLEYYNNLYNKNIINVFKFFNIKINILLYFNILYYLEKIFKNIFKYNLNNYINCLKKENLINLNFYFYFLIFYNQFNYKDVYSTLYLYLFYFYQIRFHKFYIFNNFKNINNYKFLYLNFFKTYKFVNIKLFNYNKFKYDLFFKILNKLYIINKYNLNKIIYFKKIYLFEIIYL
jgi:hypothetical protein